MPQRPLKLQRAIAHSFVEPPPVHPNFGEVADMRFDVKINFITGVFVAEINSTPGRGSSNKMFVHMILFGFA